MERAATFVGKGKRKMLMLKRWQKENKFHQWKVSNAYLTIILLRFLAVTSVNLACSSSHSKQGLSPSAHRGNGATDLILVK